MTAETSNSWTFPLCPQSPGLTIDWSAMESYPWLDAMKGCLQDAHHHAEGDVLTHTKMVCENLVSLKRWQQLDDTARSVLFAAALLHDVAKPSTTVIDDDGQISSLKHTRKGAPMSRLLLWKRKEFGFPAFAQREQIVGLVRYSGLPLWFFEKEDPVRALIRASQCVRLDWLSILAEADVNGRSCEDKPELLDRVHMFIDFANEHDCFDKPRPFPNDHSRYTYFYSNRRDPEREVYDDTRGKVVLMSGLPGAGKNHCIESEFRGIPIVSLDAVRENLDIDPADDQGPVIVAAKEKARGYLRSGEPFIWNATNVSRRLRHNLISWMQSYNPRVQIVYVEPKSFESLQCQNMEREKAVPSEVLNKLTNALEVPDLSESHELLVRTT